jgi:hypothetical protein
MRVRTLVALLLAVLAAACTGAPPDRRSQLADLSAQIRAMPGVTQVGNTINDHVARGPAYFELDVQVADAITADQVAAVTSAYLDALHDDDYSAYSAELDMRYGDNVFAVSGDRPVEDHDQIVAQARSWVRLRQLWPGNTVGLRATTKAAPSSGTVQLPDAADYTAVTVAVGKLGTDFGDLTGGDWTVSASNQHPAEIRTSRRLPNQQELELWTALNADQSIPHADVLTINGPATGPLWVSEKIGTDDPELALRLAQQHLPIVARLPVPVLYSASNQYRGHIGFRGQATGPVTVSIGGCMKRDYRPSPPEQALVDRYENCRR